jgi:microcin C transport system substrate-binding protein
VRNKTLWGKIKNIVLGLLFTRSDTDDILVNDKGEKASFTLIYPGGSIERHLTVMQQDFRRAGVDIKLQQLEYGTLFERALQRKFEMLMLGMTAGFYPDPREYLFSNFKNIAGNNDFFGFGTPQVDALIKTYEESLDPDARQKAMFQIDQIVHDEALYIPFWTAPYDRIAYWDYVQFPDFYLPKRASNTIQTWNFWIDPQKKAALAEAMKTGKAYPVDKNIDKDFYNVRQKFQ